RLIVCQYKLGRGDIVGQVELFLVPLVLDHFNDVGLRKNFFAFLFQLGQGIGIDMFDLDGNDIAVLAKFIHGIIVRQFALDKFLGNILTGRLGVRVQNMDVYIIVDGRLDDHSSQLASANDS